MAAAWRKCRNLRLAVYAIRAVSSSASRRHTVFQSDLDISIEQVTATQVFEFLLANADGKEGFTPTRLALRASNTNVGKQEAAEFWNVNLTLTHLLYTAKTPK